MVERRTDRTDKAGDGWLYALAAVIYVALGVRYKGLVLNWVVGPTFPFMVVYAVPRWLQRLARRLQAPPRPATVREVAR
jgi:hypothetical protein